MLSLWHAPTTQMWGYEERETPGAGLLASLAVVQQNFSWGGTTYMSMHHR